MNMAKFVGEKEINTRLRALTKDVQALREELQATLKREPSRPHTDPDLRATAADDPPRRKSPVRKF